jgi:hypothetical protein
LLPPFGFLTCRVRERMKHHRHDHESLYTERYRATVAGRGTMKTSNAAITDLHTMNDLPGVTPKRRAVQPTWTRLPSTPTCELLAASSC